MSKAVAVVMTMISSVNLAVDLADRPGLPWHDLVVSGRWGQLTPKLKQKAAFIAGCIQKAAISPGRRDPG
jgi:hypothetical protein